ncbi:site-specific integrase [Vreelandella titanicae]|uniref:site-specific integrase n=1 Tax=Halomonadaceae TaxID=28256 RepID=UPI000ECB6F5E|nr:MULTISPECIES: site-specific integrase [Halomonas]HCC83012.1 site-specific integrase [Methylophaga sp.]|tara:strand:+ start:6043 stop:7377 length:1335 start_codon:yes stop_codon:yes gene_type:complete
MSKLQIAKYPRLDFILTSSRKHESSNCPLPLIIKNDGSFDWEANAYLTNYGGGSQVYNISPLATTVVKKAYSLNIFTSFLDDNKIKLEMIDDSIIYDFIETLNDRGVNDDTIISHGRTALNYILYLSGKYPEWQLATSNFSLDKKFNVHYSLSSFQKNGRNIEYITHRALDGLIHISRETDYIRDHELMMWFDAINHTTYHPNINDFLVTRWQALGTLLDISGSRITEIHKITRSMIKKAMHPLADVNEVAVIRDLPILKGKYKGKTRQVPTTMDDLQIIMIHILKVEDKFPNLNHDAIFVDIRTGNPLTASYIKNYAKKVINGSQYSDYLKHLNNHSFRHRFITINIAKAIQKISSSGSFFNVLTVAADACRKLTMHASNDTLSRYIHLASEYNNLQNGNNENISTQVRIRIQKMKTIAKDLRLNNINENKALQKLLVLLDEL